MVEMVASAVLIPSLEEICSSSPKTAFATSCFAGVGAAGRRSSANGVGVRSSLVAARLIGDNKKTAA
jgi:hypothetical protein